MNQEEILLKFMDYCEQIDQTWAREFRAWIPEFLDKMEDK